MPTATAKYVGENWVPLPDFSETLKEALRAFYPDQGAESDPAWGHPADAFVAEVLAEAGWAQEALYWQRFDTTQAEVRAELADLLKSLHAGASKLRNLSPDVDRRLGADADPMGCADRISREIEHLTAAAAAVDQMGKARKRQDKHHDVAVELSIRVLRVLARHGVPAAATGDPYYGYTSAAVKILKLIGDELGLVRSESTWRDTILEAKRQAPDLQ